MLILFELLYDGSFGQSSARKRIVLIISPLERASERVVSLFPKCPKMIATRVSKILRLFESLLASLQLQQRSFRLFLGWLGLLHEK